MSTSTTKAVIATLSEQTSPFGHTALTMTVSNIKSGPSMFTLSN